MLYENDMPYMYIAAKKKWTSHISYNTLEDYINYNRFLLKYVHIDVCYISYRVANNNTLDKSSLNSPLVYSEIKELTIKVSMLYLVILFDNDT